jgi:phosphoribosylanthranilate isomerase
MRIKICGITREQDARAAARAGADFIGLNFYPASPRYVGGATDPGASAALMAAVEPPAVAVAVTVNPEMPNAQCQVPNSILHLALDTWHFKVVQLHGDEPASLADWLIGRGVKVIKAFHAGGADFAGGVNRWLAKVRQPAGLLAVLLDTPPPAPRQYGGSGKRFNWEWIAQAREKGELAGWPPLVLAGGLTPSNVAKAVRIARPWGVDSASGVEVEDSPGIKSIDKIRDFVRNARVG